MTSLDRSFSGSFRHENSNQIAFYTRPEWGVSLPTQSSNTVPDLSLLPQDEEAHLQDKTAMSTRGRTTSSWTDAVSRTKQHGYTLSQPESRKALHHRLLELHSRRINLPKLIDYHDRYAHLRSTRSFNFLISLALRHVSFGTVEWLFRAMESAKVPHNAETRKLVIRWYVATGLWDRAWRELNEIGATQQHVGVVSEVMWVEFFKGLCRGVGFKRLIHPTESARMQGCEPVLVYARRFVLLMENQPDLRARTRPQVLHFVIYALLQMKQREDALSLTRRYLDCISRDPPIHRSITESSLKLVHLFVAFGSCQRGLRKFHEARQLLMSFLFTYPFLVPTPTTLFLLLGNLRGAKKCGTVGLECFVFFKRKWGRRVDDQRVRRRLGTLAVKEGRMDIVEETAPNSRGHGRQKSLWIRLLARRKRRLRTC